MYFTPMRCVAPRLESDFTIVQPLEEQPEIRRAYQITQTPLKSCAVARARRLGAARGRRRHCGQDADREEKIRTCTCSDVHEHAEDRPKLRRIKGRRALMSSSSPRLICNVVVTSGASTPPEGASTVTDNMSTSLTTTSSLPSEIMSSPSILYLYCG